MKPKNGFQRVVACLLAVILMLTSAPLAGLAGIELPEVFKTEAKAGVANYNGIAAAWWAENHLYDSWSSLLGQGYYDDGGDCANFVSQCIYMGGMNMTPSWNTSGFHARFATVSDGAWIRAHQLYNYVVSQGGTSIQGPQANQVSIGDLIFWKTTNDGRMHHSAIVVAIENGIPVIAYHSTRYSNGAYINERNKNWTLGYSSDRTFLVKMNGEPCVASNPKDFDVYIAARSTSLRVSPNSYAGIAYKKSIFAGDYVHVYRTENNWGYIFYYGTWGWVDLSAFNYNGHASSYRPSHVFGSWFTEVEPTCISTGTSKRVCSRCGYAETKQIPPKGHTPGAEPTCITPQTCTFCGCLLKDALGHDFEEKFVDADCYNGATISGNCKRCNLKYSYAATTAPWSGWSPVSHSVDDPADERQRVAYRWRQRDTKVTNTAVENGWTLTNKTWEQTGSGSIEYVPQWPSAFNTSHWLYSTYNKTPRYASETATTKTTVSTYDIGYIFWHYCRGSETAGSYDSNRSIYWYYGGPNGKHTTYHAYMVSSPFTYRSEERYRVYESFDASRCGDTQWWYSLQTGGEGLLTVKRCNYVDYRVKCSWEKYSDWSDWTVASELPENIQNMIKNGQSTLTVGNTTYTVEKRNEYQYSLKNALGHDWHEDSSYLADESTGRHIWKVVTASTETESGKAVAICNRDSSHTMEKALPSTGCNHSWGEWSEIPCPEGGVSKRTCAKCGAKEEKVIEEGHVWGEWKTVKEAVACKEDGLERRICSRTPQNPPAESHIQERTIPAHELEFVDSVNPTCTEEGYDLYECAVCGTEEKRNVVLALGHDMGEWILKTAPTCTESGKEVSTCRRCGYTEDRDVSPLGHNVVSNELPATVINPDDERIKTICEIHETTYKCSRCDYTEPTKTEEISHDWEKNSDGSLKWNTVTKAEHGVNGEEVNRCLRHESHVQNRFVPMPSDHVWKEKVETKPCSYDPKTGTERKGTKTTSFVCEICNDKVPGDTEIVDHNFGEWKTVREATCTEEGINRRECKVCSFPEEQIISATGHSTSPLDEAYEASSDKMELVSSVKNVCGSGTIDTYRCKHIDKNTNERCTYTVVIGELNDHNFGDYIIDKQPTCTEPGSKHRECQNEGCTCKTNPEEIPPIGHNYAESTKTAATCTEPEKILMVCKNDSSHRYEKETGQPLGHDIVSDAKVEPTCVKTGLTEGTHCKRCSVIFEKQEVIPALGHDYGNWVDDGNGKTHTKTCKREICNESVTEHIVKKDHVMKETDRKEATCYAEGYVEYTCSDCGYNYREPLEKIAHTPGEAVKENEVPATCTEDGSYDEVVYCSVEECKKELSRTQKTTEKLGHDYGDWTSVDGENHKRVCKRDESHVETAKHVMKEADRKEATCTTDGYINYKCDDCGYTYSETIKAPGHKYEETVTDPTCLTEGFTTHTCSVCGNSYVDSYVPALGHDYGNWVDDGNGKTHTKTCKREICNESVTEHIVKKDHVMKETDRKEATCYAEGYVEYTCSDCGYNYREPLEKIAHTPGEAVKENEVPATCTEDGSYDEVVYCSVEECKAELSRTQKTTEKLGHDYGDWTSVDGENHKRVCKRDESHVETAKHVMKETDRKAATCYAEGYVEYTCSDCGYSYKTVLGLGEHNLSVWNDDNDDTHTSHCQNEGCTYSVTKDHNFDVILEKKDASAREGGYVIYQCSACGHTRREDIPPVEPSEIVPDKKAVEVGGKALITLSASAATNYVKVITKSKTPIDVILVLDQSGSMKCDVSASPNAEPPLVEPDTSKRKVLIKNANNFVDAIIEDSAKTGADHRIALVGFAMAEIESSNYKAYENTGILVTNSGNKFVGYKELKSKNNYSDALISASSENQKKLHDAVKAIDARGATATDKGLEIAKNIFASSKDNGSRKRVVLLITDGVPTHFSASNYENITAAASGAITYAREIKNSQNASIYTLAVHNGAKVEEEFTEYEDGYKGPDGRVEPYDINRFMHLVSSNYPQAVSMDCYGNGSRESGYYMTATNQEAFKKCFETVKSTEITDTSLFDLVTLYDTLSPNLTLTLEDERAMRDDLVKNFGMKNEDIIVSRENGTTKLEFHNVKVKKVDGKHVAQVSFKASLNRNTLEKGDYATNTIDAGIKINEITQKNFEIPSVTVDTERCIVEFFINGVSYSIVDYNLGDRIELPATDLATWVTDSVVEKQYTSYESETEADDEYTVTWKTNGTKTSEKYKYGEVINVPEKVDAPQGMKFAFWTPGVSHFMPAHDLTYTAVYKKAHVCSFKESYEGDCKKGLTLVKTCDCGKVEKTVLEPREHVTKAVVSDKTGKFLVHCTVCGKSNNTVLEYKKKHGGPSTYLSLNLTENNISIQPGENGLIISVYLGSDYNGKTYNVYRLDKTKKVLVGSYKTENGYLTFTAEHFSIYALCELGEDGNVLEEPNYEKALCAINGHDYKAVVTEPTCRSEGFTTYTCSVCKDSYKDDVTPKVSHNYTAVETAATCTAGGFTTYTCSFCGESYKANETPALGHSDSNGDGICDRCGEKLQESTPGGKCSHICHSTNSFSKLIWAIIRIFYKIFNTNRICSCGAKHW